MWNKIRDFCQDLFVGWLFTAPGIAVCTAIGGVVMAWSTYATVALKEYAPLSIAVASVFGFISVLAMLRIAASCYLVIKRSLNTKKSTFIEVKIENRRANLVAKSNIYKEPSMQLEDGRIVNIQAAPQDANRKTRRAVAAQAAPTFTQLPVKINIMAHFEIPIAPETFLVRVESLFGAAPTKEASSVDERFANVVLANVPDSCTFRVYFNQ